MTLTSAVRTSCSWSCGDTQETLVRSNRAARSDQTVQLTNNTSDGAKRARYAQSLGAQMCLGFVEIHHDDAHAPNLVHGDVKSGAQAVRRIM